MSDSYNFHFNSGIISVTMNDDPFQKNIEYGVDNKSYKLSQLKTAKLIIHDAAENEFLSLVVTDTNVGQPVILVPDTTYNKFKFEIEFKPTTAPIESIDIVFCSQVKLTSSGQSTEQNKQQFKFIERYAVPITAELEFLYDDNGKESILEKITHTINPASIRYNPQRGDQSYNISLKDKRGLIKNKTITGIIVTLIFDSSINNGIAATYEKKFCAIAAIIPTVLETFCHNQSLPAPPPKPDTAVLRPSNKTYSSTKIVPVGETKEISLTPIYSSIDNIVNGDYSYDNLFDKGKRPPLSGLQITEYGYGYTWQPVGSNRDDFWQNRVETNNPHGDKCIHIIAVVDKPFVIENTSIINGFARASLRPYYKEVASMKVKLYYVNIAESTTTFTDGEKSSLNNVISTLSAFASDTSVPSSKLTNINNAISSYNNSVSENLKIKDITFKSISLPNHSKDIESKFINPINGINGNKQMAHVDFVPNNSTPLYSTAQPDIKTNNDIDMNINAYPCKKDAIIDNNELKTFLSQHPDAAIIAVEFIIDSKPRDPAMVEYERLSTPTIYATTAAQYTFKLYTLVSPDANEYAQAYYCNGNSWIATNYYLKKSSYLAITELLVEGKYAYA
jgi:hypothetical protein